LEGASARVTPGARVGLVGRNGSGKTTLFNVIAGDLSAEHGSVETAAALAHWTAGAGSAERPGSLIEIVLKAQYRAQSAAGRS